MFLDCLHGEQIGFSVLGIFVIDKNTIVTVRIVSKSEKRLFRRVHS